jgi:hypothetical protein
MGCVYVLQRSAALSFCCPLVCGLVLQCRHQTVELAHVFDSILYMCCGGAVNVIICIVGGIDLIGMAECEACCQERSFGSLCGWAYAHSCSSSLCGVRHCRYLWAWEEPLAHRLGHQSALAWA